MSGAAEAGVPDADARRALLLILAVLKRHGRALRALLAQVGGPELDGVLEALARRERALGEAARQLRAGAAQAAADSNRRSGGAGDASRQGVLPLTEPTGATGIDARGRRYPQGRGGSIGEAADERRGRDEQGRMRQLRERSSHEVTQAVRLHQKACM